MGLLAALLQFAPFALDAGMKLAPLISEALGKGEGDSDVEKYAGKALQMVPTLLAAGIAVAEVTASLRRTNDDIARMIAENRGPNDAEWKAQDERIKALEDQLDTAAKKP